MSKADLKAAMDSLQIKKPFRLPARQPQFIPPPPVPEATQVSAETKDPAQTSVLLETPDSQRAMVSAGLEVASSAEDSTGTRVSVEPPVVPIPMVAGSTPVNLATQVPTQAEDDTTSPASQESTVAGETLVATQTRAASEQDSSVNLEVQSTPKLQEGYTRVPNGILMRIARGEFIKSEVQILLIIARFTVSFQKRHAPLSKSVLERQTGLRGPAILHAISNLLEKKVIEKIPGDQYRPNMLGLAFEDEFDFFSKGKTLVAGGTRVPDKARVPQATENLLGDAPGGATGTSAGVAPGTSFKDTQTNLNDTFSPGEPRTSVELYLTNLKPERKRISEQQAYEKLKAEYSSGTIAEAFSELVRLDPGGTQYHSPLAFLAVSIEQVLKSQRAAMGTERGRHAHKAEIEAAKLAKDAADSMQEQEWLRREALFSAAFPNPESRHTAIERYTAGLTFGGEVLRHGLAVSKWWEETQKGQLD